MGRLLPFDYAVRNLGRSPLRLALAVSGSAIVVLLVLAAAAFVRGMGATLTQTGAGRNMILLGAGSEESVERSEIPFGTSSIAAAAIPGIRERLGVPYVSPEIHMATIARLRRDARETYFVSLRGVEPPAYLVHPQVRIVEGRAAGPGELVVGELAATRMGVPEEQLAPGRSLWFEDREWPIVGRFEAPGTVMEAEIWCGLDDLRVAAKRETLSCVVLTLGDDGEASDVDLFTKMRTDLELVAMPESGYYAAVFAFYEPVRGMVWATALMVAAGAFFGGLNTMYAAFAARIRELASLQALGFGRGAILLSLVQESLLAAAAGSLVAAAAALLVLDGLAVRISMGAFGLAVDGRVMAVGMAAGLLLGVAGALPPAWRCLKMPVAEALKSA